jgi:translation elongation factor aEF-1 beta
MPTSPQVKLDVIKHKAKSLIEKGEGKNPTFTEEPIAFGLKAIIASFSLDESKELEVIEKSLGEIEDVNSIQVVDMRRAFG